MTYTDETGPLPEPPATLRIMRGTKIHRLDDEGRSITRVVDRTIIVYGLYIKNRRPALYTFVYDGWPWTVEARKVDVIG